MQRSSADWFRRFVSIVGAMVPMALSAGEPAPSSDTSDTGSVRDWQSEAFEYPLSMVVLDVKPSGPVPGERVAGLSSVLTSTVASHDEFRVISSGDVREILGFEAQRQLLVCEDDACLTELGGALGAPYLLSSEVSFFGASWLLTLVLVDLRDAQPIGRVTIRRATEEELLDEMDTAVLHVTKRLLRDGESRANMQPLRASPRSPSGPSRGQRALMRGAIGTGAAMLAGGSVLYGWGLSQYFVMSSATQNDDAVFTRAEANRHELGTNMGLGLIGAGALLAGGGLLLRRSFAPAHGTGDHDLPVDGGTLPSGTPSTSSRPQIEVFPIAFRDGAGLLLEVRGW